MKTVLFIALFIGAITFGKGFVSNISNAANNIKSHNQKVERFYAQNNIHHY